MRLSGQSRRSGETGRARGTGSWLWDFFNLLEMGEKLNPSLTNMATYTRPNNDDGNGRASMEAGISWGYSSRQRTMDSEGFWVQEKNFPREEPLNWVSNTMWSALKSSTYSNIMETE